MSGEELFEQERQYLFAIAYRMLGSATDADDMIQEAWLRWNKTLQPDVANPTAFLARTITRLCIDRLRELKRRREEYVGPWLAEPIAEDPPDRNELAESLSLAFVTLLERLTPVERAVFLLRQVFGYEYNEIADVVGKAEANCRKVFSRARDHLAGDTIRYETSPEAQRKMIESFMEAAGSGDASRLESILREDVEFWSDGGGKVLAAKVVVRGRAPVANFILGISRQQPDDLSIEFNAVNGQVGLLLRESGKLTTVFVFQSIDGEAHRIHAIRNPDKLQRLSRELS
ncbi:RNA polymerase sigma factor SigJ [Planctomycetota bacterium]|nr:RNA polymerase sigma factor SigJ [Planctomycetota bacterium]